nr:uncharacterized protein LOC110372036 isoform X1 [Helicoverpa armigera]
MFSQAFTFLLGYLAVVSSREAVRPMPTITNSLVNLGKMEISFYFNGNGRDPNHHPNPPESQSYNQMPPSVFIPKMETIIEEPCLCSSLRSPKDSLLSNPSSFLNKILMHNDLFSFNKDPLSSTLCCDSHEQIQEGTIVFELPATPKPKPGPARSNLPMMPFLLDSIIPNKSMLPPLKTKAIEIFLFPKKKDMANVMNTFEMAKFPKKKDSIAKDGITVVGDKKIENNVSFFKPPPPVRKESTAQIVVTKDNETEKPVEDDKMLVEPANKPNAV